MKLSTHRLWQFPIMLLGGGIVTVITLLCTFAPLLTNLEPQQQQTWVGAQGPGFQHPPCLGYQKYITQSQPDLPLELQGAKQLVFETQKKETQDLRVLVRNGICEKMFWFEGAMPCSNILLKAKNTHQLFPDGHSVTLTQDLELRLGEKGSLEELSPSKGDRVLFFRILVQAYPKELCTMTLDQAGAIESLVVNQRKVASFSFMGEDCISVSKDGVNILRYHILGTDDLGRDVWSRCLYGGRISLMVGAVATLVSLIIGIVVGSISGYLGGRWDRLIMSGIDMLYAIPFMFLVILLLVLFGRSLVMLFIALGAVQWLTMARIVRTQVISLKKLPYIDAMRCAQAPAWAILYRHILPNMLGPIIIYATLTVPAVILEESFLSFIGLTVQFQGQSIDSWGSLVNQGMLSLGQHGENAWLLIFPSLAMGLTLLGLNLCGDGLRDFLDPRHSN
jgi:oligopeptide transport system permease protein